MNSVAASPVLPRKLRGPLLAACGIDIARNSAVEPRCYFSSEKITVSERAFINVGCILEAAHPIHIGRDVSLAPGVVVITATHAFGGTEHRAGSPTGAGVKIEDGCWIGAGATIMPGVTVGAGCVVGACALVTADCAPNGLYVGVPARRLRDL